MMSLTNLTIKLEVFKMMHSYTTNGKDRIKVISWLAFTSVVVAPILTAFANDKLQYLSQKYSNINFSAISVSATVLFGFCWFLLINVIWKFFLVQKLLEVPNINGEWKCTGIGLKYDDPTKRYDWTGTLIICQKYDKIEIILNTENSSSHSYSSIAHLENHGNGECELIYMYNNKPYVSDSDLHEHEGFCTITFKKNGTAIGKYYTNTDRKSYGIMELVKK